MRTHDIKKVVVSFLIIFGLGLCYPFFQGVNAAEGGQTGADAVIEFYGEGEPAKKANGSSSEEPNKLLPNTGHKSISILYGLALLFVVGMSGYFRKTLHKEVAK